MIALVTALVILPAAWYGGVMALKAEVGFDMHLAYAPAARDVLDGRNPYPATLDGAEVLNEHAYAYPPLLAFLVVPVTVFSDVTAGYIGAYTVLLLAGLVLLVLGVRDWRCYGAALLWAPTYNAAQNANVSIAVALALALAWRWRERIWRPGAALGLAIALKLVMAPLLLWPLAMRRTRAALAGGVVAAAAVLVPWAAIGFAGLTGYPSLLRRLEDLESEQSYSVYSALVGFDVPAFAATAVTLAAGLVLAVACFRWGRSGDDRRSLTAAVALVLVASPLVWQHYYTLLLVPVALAWPRLSPAWLLPVLMWAMPVAGDGNALQTLLAAGTAALVVLLCLMPGLRHAETSARGDWLPRQLRPTEA
jgi:alpha-1,2-mannosyltransferase